MFHLLLLISLIGLIRSQTGDVNVQCTAKFCEDFVNTPETNPCTQQKFCENSDSKNIYQLPSLGPCNCCAYCLEKIEEGGRCEIGEVGAAISLSICGDGLFCSPESATCVSMSVADRACPDGQKLFDDKKQDGTLGHLELRPTCDEHGFYEPYVCVPNEICYCVDEDGSRIFGTVPFTTMANMLLKCKCSRSYNAAKKFFGDSFQTVQHMRCESNGDYYKIQCLDEENCYCVDAEDGAPTFPDFPPVPMINISHSILPCLDNHDGAEYHRICERKYLEQMMEVDEFKALGVEVVGVQFPSCQPDGYFEAVQENKTHKYCADLDGSVLDTFVVPLDNITLTENMNCNCARSRSMLENPDIIELPECSANGNYEPIQCRRGLCRCVDENGNQNAKEVGYEDMDSLNCN